MKLSNKTLLKLTHGVISYKEKRNGYISFYSFSEEQIEYFKFNPFFYDRCKFQSSITIEFKTDANKISFDYFISCVGSKDSLDVYVDDNAYQFININDINEKGKLEISLPVGNKKICIYFPIDVEFEIKNFVIEGRYSKVNKRKEKVLWLGDSITQGYGASATSFTYVNVANKTLKYDVVNQGIGGYYYDYKSLMPLQDFYPDKIIISLGTNQIFSTDTKETIENFYNKLAELYPNVKTYVVTPIFRCDHENGLELVENVTELIVEKCKQYENIHIIDGLKLVPHLDYFFLDRLHPNALGMKIYGDNLAKEILKIK